VTLDFRSVRQEVADRLRELPQDLYEGVVPDDEELKTSNGVVLPYNVLTWTNPIAERRNRGIMGVRKVLFAVTCTVHSISPDYDASIDVHMDVFNALTGFQPTNASEMLPWGGFSMNTTTDKAKPTKYIHTQGFRMYINTILELD